MPCIVTSVFSVEVHGAVDGCCGSGGGGGGGSGNLKDCGDLVMFVKNSFV